MIINFRKTGNQRKADSDLLLKAQLDTLFGNSKLLVVGQFTTATIVLGWLWGQVDSLLLLAWYVISFIHPLTRILFTRLYLRDRQQRTLLWRNCYLFGSVLNGLVWGALVFLDVSPASYYIILLVLAGLMTMTVATSSIYRPAVTFYIAPIGLSASAQGLVYQIQYPEQGWLIVFLITVAYVLSLLGLSRVSNRSLLNGLQLNFENSELVKKLTLQKQELEEARAIAEKASHDKSKFLATASHDLRQPLHALGLFIGSLKFARSEQERKGIQEKLEVTHASLSELFDALLDMSKMDADAIDFQVQSVSAKTMMLKIADEFSVLAKEKNIRLRVRANDICVQTDPLWLERVLRNLLSNALRYTEQGSVLLSVRKRSGSALIQVWDTGVGIPEESIDEIFNEFTQLKIPVINGRVGLGLGLSIVHRLCKLMGHDISVNSTINKGSVFSLTLALGQEAPANRALEYAVYAANHSLEGKCILVADDEAEVRQAMQMMLQKWGCRVLTADSFESAVRQIESEETLPDALVTDYRFADQNTGLDLVKHIEAAYSKRVPVLMVTGDTSVDNVRQFKASGVRVLHKPVQQAKIRMMLDHLCKEPSVSD